MITYAAAVAIFIIGIAIGIFIMAKVVQAARRKNLKDWAHGVSDLQ